MTWTQGTGRLEGVVGQARVVAVLDGVVPGAPLEYFADGCLEIP